MSPVSAPPTVPQLRALVAVADTLHFGEAAAHLGLSQPSISTAIAGLEAGLGVLLVDRSTRRVLLTQVGRDVATHARTVLASLDRLVEAAERGGQPFSGPLRLGIIPTVAPYVLAPILRALGRHFPRLRPDVTEAQTARLLDDLAVGRLDLILVALPSGGREVTEIPLYEEDFVLLVPEDHPLAGASGLDPSVLVGLRLLLLEEGHCLRDQALDVCRQVGASTTHPARAASLTTVAQLVAAGLGATLLPASAVPVEVRKGRLATATFGQPAPGRRLGLAHRSGSDRAEEYEAIADRLRQVLRAGPLPLRTDAGSTPVPRRPPHPSPALALGAGRAARAASSRSRTRRS
jgi:LysR family hydrogen peroxide-inducible transcriptional activator